MLGEKLLELRTLFNMSQKEVAERIDSSNHLVGKYETGSSQPSLDTLTQFAKLYCTSVDYLIGLQTSKVIVLDNLSQEQKIVIRIIVDTLKEYFQKDV